ncbi:MAG: hypothetical protein WA876_16570, partial [Candidatus Acidiferrales bacterium]
MRRFARMCVRMGMTGWVAALAVGVAMTQAESNATRGVAPGGASPAPTKGERQGAAFSKKLECRVAEAEERMGRMMRMSTTAGVIFAMLLSGQAAMAQTQQSGAGNARPRARDLGIRIGVDEPGALDAITDV